jgi:hypothetical protein
MGEFEYIVPTGIACKGKGKQSKRKYFILVA